MRVVIIEDEKPAANHLKWLLQQIDENIEVVDEIQTVREAIQRLPDTRADLFFLDIHLADDLCFKIFESVVITTPVIFTTAYDQYAIEAFRLNSIDYLLKPIEQEKLEASLAKLQTVQKAFRKNELNIDALINAFNPQPTYKTRFIVQVGNKIRPVKAAETAFFQSTDKSCYLTTFDNRTYDVEGSLDKIEQTLNPEQFFRINRQFIINIEAVADVVTLSATKLRVKLTTPSDDLFVSIRRIKCFKDWLES